MVIKNKNVNPSQVGEGVERKILASGGGMMSVEVKFKKGAIGAVHTHPHEQVSYVLSGSFEFELNSEKHIIKERISYYLNRKNDLLG